MIEEHNRAQINRPFGQSSFLSARRECVAGRLRTGAWPGITASASGSAADGDRVAIYTRERERESAQKQSTHGVKYTPHEKSRRWTQVDTLNAAQNRKTDRCCRCGAFADQPKALTDDPTE